MTVVNRISCCMNILEGAEVVLMEAGVEVGSCGTISVRDGATVENQTYVLSCGGVLSDSVKVKKIGRTYVQVAELTIRGTGKSFKI